MKYILVTHAGKTIYFNKRVFKTPAIIPVHESHLPILKQILKSLDVNNYQITGENPIGKKIKVRDKITRDKIEQTEVEQDNLIENINLDKIEDLDELLNMEDPENA